LSATFLLPRLLKTTYFAKMRSCVFLVLGAAMYFLTFSATHIQMTLLMVIFGCGFTLLHIFWESLMQQLSPQQHLGKIMSLLSAYKGACYLVTILCGSLVVKLWDCPSLLLLGALFMGSSALLINR
jgi:predicted MFS family arabinose efflux permease